MEKKITESIVIEGLKSLMKAPIDHDKISINGIVYERHKSFDGFRLLLKEFYKQNQQLDFLYPVLDDYVELSKADKLDTPEEDVLMDIIKLINGDCSLSMTLEYPEEPSTEYRYIPKW